MTYQMRFSPKIILQTCTLAALVSVCTVAVQAETQSSGNRPFRSMAIAPDDPDDCRVPRPSTDLAETAYLRNGYRAILRILIAEERIEQETCDCLLGGFSWQDALDQLDRFQTSDNPRLPFKVLDLYAMADALEAEHAELCSE